MKIGCDLDEVIVEFIKKFIDFYNHEIGSNLKFEDWKKYWFRDVVGISKEEERKWINNFYDSGFFDDISLVEGALEGITQLAKDSEMFVVTSRPLRYKEKTDKFFNKYLKNLCKLVYARGDNGEELDKGLDKGIICRDLGIKLMIEDHMDYALNCSVNGVETFLLTKP